jgi:hypothetical protein
VPSILSVAGSPITTSGTLAVTLANQTANTIFAGPTSGGAAAPTFRSLVAADVPAGVVLWSALGNAAADLTLANSTFNTTFNQTSAVNWKWQNTVAADATGVVSSSPILNLNGTRFIDGASATDSWTIQNVVATPNVKAATNISETSGSVVTLTVGASHGFTISEVVTFSGLTVGSWLNGQHATITNTSGTTIVFTDPTGHGTQASTATTGSVIQADQSSLLQFTHSGTPGSPALNTFTGIAAPYLVLQGSGAGIVFATSPGTGIPSTTSYGWFQNIANGSLAINCRNNSTTGITVSQTGVLNWSVTNTGLVSKYAGFNTVSFGQAAEVALVDLTAQNAAIAATTLYAVPATGQGMYRISWSAAITTAATTGAATSTLGGANGFQIVATSPTDSVAKTYPRTSTAGVNNDATNTTATGISGVIFVFAKASTNIQYQFGYTSDTAGQMVYELHIRCELM